MDKLIWFFTNAGLLDIVGPLLLPIGIALALYQSHYPFVIAKELWRRVRARGRGRIEEPRRLGAAVIIPSLLRVAEEVDGMIVALQSAADNEYPGELVLVASVDGRGGQSAKLFADLSRRARAIETKPGVHIFVTGALERQGKGMAVDHGVREIVRRVERGELTRPAVFFNLDADCRIETHALERMVAELDRKSVFTGQRGMIVTSHVAIDPEHAWQGWRRFFTVEGQLALGIAREYFVSLGLGRHNVFRLLPQLGASGALYCTWFELADTAPRFARFIESMTWGDWLRWWLGYPPPRFVPDELEPLPEAMTGMGDDTWMSFLACAARWRGGELTLDLPRTPAHAFAYACWSYVFRPFRYDPHARIFTESPTTVRALFKQRMRWNVSRIWTVQKWGLAHFYHWQLGIPAFADIVLSILFQSMIVAGLLLLPFSKAPAMWMALVVVVEGGYFVERTSGTLLSLWVDGSLRKNARVLLALPFAGIFHFVFNIASTLVGFAQQVLGRGMNDGFAPEQTLIRGRTGRIALGYRARRFVSLCVRSIVRGDVPLGWFWLGWHETPWTQSGYAGWSAPKKPQTALGAETTSALASAEPANAAPLSVTPEPGTPLAELDTLGEELPDTGVRRREKRGSDETTISLVG